MFGLSSDLQMFSFFLYFLSQSQPDPRLDVIKSSFLHSWNGYTKCALGHDFLRPITCKSVDWFNASLTLIDSLDTLWIMGLHEEFDTAVSFLESNFTNIACGSVFELTIRVVGGLMSAYQLSGRKSLLGIAKNFTDQLLISFNTGTGLPMPDIDMQNRIGKSWGWAPRTVFLSHAGSLLPELMTLAQHLDDDDIREASDKVLDFFFENEGLDGLWPIKINFDTGLFSNLEISFDAYGDSFYEYLLKLYILTDGKCKKCGEMYQKAVSGIKKYLLRENEEYAFVGRIKDEQLNNQIGHLSFFIPGMIALGSQYFDKDDLNLSIKLQDTNAKWHNSTKTGLMGDEFTVNSDFSVSMTDPSYKLRPEFIEGCFYLFRLTGDEKWRVIGWNYVQNLIKYCETTFGYGVLNNVNNPDHGIADFQDSFLLSETFKYAYLLFSDSNIISLDEYVFTTEAHPIRHFEKDWMNKYYTNKKGFV